MSPKRQQVLTVLKRVSCLKCPKKASCPKLSPAKGNKSSLSQKEYLVPNAQKKHLVQNVLIVPPQKANDDVECEFRHLSLAEYLTAIHVHTTGQPLKVFSTESN